MRGSRPILAKREADALIERTTTHDNQREERGGPRLVCQREYEGEREPDNN